MMPNNGISQNVNGNTQRVIDVIDSMAPKVGLGYVFLLQCVERTFVRFRISSRNFFRMTLSDVGAKVGESQWPLHHWLPAWRTYPDALLSLRRMEEENIQGFPRWVCGGAHWDVFVVLFLVDRLESVPWATGEWWIFQKCGRHDCSRRDVGGCDKLHIKLQCKNVLNLYQNKYHYFSAKT